jgi:pyridoxal phosphate enzyme (YggS family)
MGVRREEGEAVDLSIGQRLAAIQERVRTACVRSGRDPAEVRLMGVSKFHDRARVDAAWEAGLRLFGESRVQEAQAKFTGLREERPGMELHMIGSLQRNKIKASLPLFHCVQSVDRDELITALGVQAEGGRTGPLSILLELNSGEASKGGFASEESLFQGVEMALSYPGLRLQGLMTMAPFTGDEKEIRRAFRALHKARTALQARFPCADWPILSMGMSGDFEIAIEEGSTMIRIGTALFGERT